MKMRKQSQAGDRGYQEKEIPNGIDWDLGVDDLCLRVVAAPAKAKHDALGAVPSGQ
jgi:hypothetical protein